jgi:hypothetical protein
MELYQKLSFPQRAQIFKLFLPQAAQLPKTNSPYPSSMFSVKGNKIISSLCALLGYCSNQWVDEPILGFLSIFSTEERPTTQFDYSTFLADSIHEQLLNFTSEGMFSVFLNIGLHVHFLSSGQVLLFNAENGQGREAAGGNNLDFTTQTKFNRVQFQIVYRAVLPPYGEHAQWQT